MRVNWKFKCCGWIAFVLVASITYELWYLGQRAYHNSKNVYRYHKQTFEISVNDGTIKHSHRLDVKTAEKIFSHEEVTQFILLILKNETLSTALKNVWESYRSQNQDSDRVTNFENSGDLILKDLLNKRNKNIFLDVNEQYLEFNVINQTCNSIEDTLRGKGRCVMSLEGTLCSERKIPPPRRGKKPKQKAQLRKWTKHETDVCDYMYMNSTSYAAPLPYLKNPCYEECDGGYNTVRCLPYYMIIGMPKCGTTSLYFDLTHHKDVVRAKRKEPMYFNRMCFRGMRFADYTTNFDDLRARIVAENNFSRLISGDGSVDIAFDSKDWRHFPGNEGLLEPKYVLPFFIHKVLPKLKVIIMLRDPVERAFSDYLYEAPVANYLISLEDFHQAVHRAISNYKKCQTQYSIRACAYNASLEYYKGRLRVGMYHIFLKDWFQIYPANQILVINFDDYINHREDVLNRVARFLELSDLTEAESKLFIADHNKKNMRSNQTQALGDMLPETRDMLRQFYRPFNVNLSRLLHSDHYLWSN